MRPPSVAHAGRQLGESSTPLDGLCPTEHRSLVVLIGRGSRGLPWLGQNTHSLKVGLVCVQETWTPQFPCLPDDQPFRHNGPENSHGREAGFPFHQDVPTTRVFGLVDSLRIRWRLVSEIVCVCSYYTPHGSSDNSSRIQFWEDLVAFDFFYRGRNGKKSVAAERNAQRQHTTSERLIPLYRSARSGADPSTPAQASH